MGEQAAVVVKVDILAVRTDQEGRQPSSWGRPTMSLGFISEMSCVTASLMQ